MTPPTLVATESATWTWTIVETSFSGGNPWGERAYAPTDTAATPVIVVDLRAVRQTILGFGGALTESAAWALSQLSPDQNSCDFSLSTWSLDETPGDFDLAEFTLEPMRTWVMPLVHEAFAAAGGKLQLLASPWSPPAWMKTTGKMCHGGELRPDCRDAWARFYVKFITALRDEEQIPVWGLTVQNEPAAVQVWESCVYSAEAERDFVRDHLGPALAEAGLADVRLMVWDHNRDLLLERGTAVLSDPKAAAFVWGTALHWYMSEDFSQTADLHAAFPDKHFVFSEGCWEGGAKPGQWDRGARYARNIIGDLRNWVEGWIDWNLALDLKGGPNHVGNFCDAPVLVDTEKGEAIYQSSFYYLGHFSRYFRPGAQIVASEGEAGGLHHVAALNPDGTLRG